ncbi:hypothetical protein IEO21_03730 [Rhodonia placenta]|uniref:Uncharacterized protein n=1 Tax=Rhodonia placenta TaxID=104341 RepID=A0A8H7P573_9APHY|nr:hypothetical protein IEO21_03730 [Postia placenta]
MPMQCFRIRDCTIPLALPLIATLAPTDLADTITIHTRYTSGYEKTCKDVTPIRANSKPNLVIPWCTSWRRPLVIGVRTVKAWRSLKTAETRGKHWHELAYPNRVIGERCTRGIGGSVYVKRRHDEDRIQQLMLPRIGSNGCAALESRQATGQPSSRQTRARHDECGDPPKRKSIRVMTRSSQDCVDVMVITECATK